mmetsp:Transcript_361/g.898  ORF Transcript_361/g.898 Transcript_361/m.898 type:complete len:263 (-) Transcript_361:770-1558(-)
MAAVPCVCFRSGVSGGISATADSITDTATAFTRLPASRSAVSALAWPPSIAHVAAVRFQRSHASRPPERERRGAHARAATAAVFSQPERAARCRMVCLSASAAPGGAPAASRADSDAASPRAAARCEARVPADVAALESAPAVSNARTTWSALGHALPAAKCSGVMSGTCLSACAASPVPSRPAPTPSGLTPARRSARASATRPVPQASTSALEPRSPQTPETLDPWIPSLRLAVWFSSRSSRATAAASLRQRTPARARYAA